MFQKISTIKESFAFCPSFSPLLCCLVLYCIASLSFSVLASMAENMCFANMGYGMRIQDGFSGQAQQYLYQQDSHNNNYVATASSSSSCCGGCLFTELQRHMVETDWFLQMEDQRLRSSILLEASRQREVIIQSYESRLKSLMFQMDEQITIARNRASELQSSLQIAELEAQSWKKKAAENEAAASHLRTRLATAAHYRETLSSCGSSSNNPTSENETGKEDLNLPNKMSCKLCRTRSLCSVVFLPCRHLCCCKACEPLVGHCPVCGTVKEASLEVLLG